MAGQAFQKMRNAQPNLPVPPPPEWGTLLLSIRGLVWGGPLVKGISVDEAIQMNKGQDPRVFWKVEEGVDPNDTILFTVHKALVDVFIQFIVPSLLTPPLFMQLEAAALGL